MVKIHKGSQSYHPDDAVGSSEHGAFSHFWFKDGVKLTVRTSYLKKVFSAKWNTVKFLSQRSERTVQECDLDGKSFILRRFYAEVPAHSLIKKIMQVIGRRFTFESPVLELTLPKKRYKFLLTKKIPGEILSTVWDRNYLQAFENLKQAAAILAKLHVNGIVHGHPHAGNWMVKPNGSLTLIDSKYLRELPEIPTLAAIKLHVRAVLFSSDRPNSEKHLVKRDLRHLIHPTLGLYPVQAQSIFEAYLHAYQKEYEKRAKEK